MNTEDDIMGMTCTEGIESLRIEVKNPVANLLERLEGAESEMLKMPQVNCPLAHHFTPGLYIREILMPAGSLIIGHKHKTEHANIVMRGKALVSMNGIAHTIAAPAIFTSKPGVRKVLYIIEDMIWVTTHVTDETDLKKVEEMLIEKSEAFLKHEKELIDVEIEAIKTALKA